ncbi:MAG: Smr/MutS family protein [Acidobacteriota bacterium]|nr:Smr/MutS family protein [Acidobacteriota bacterium]
MSEIEGIDLDNPFPEPFELEITDTLDLHAFRPQEVKSVVENYLTEARKKGFRVVRIIHGKGIGVQRETVRKVLADTDFVESFKNAPEFSGNTGATVVKLAVGRKQ